MKPRKKPQERHHAERSKKPQQQEEHARQLPSETDAATERGERLSTGKTIARGGHPDKGDTGA
jgi:hypothetical protein